MEIHLMTKKRKRNEIHESQFQKFDKWCKSMHICQNRTFYQTSLLEHNFRSNCIRIVVKGGVNFNQILAAVICERSLVGLFFKEGIVHKLCQPKFG